MKMCGFSHEQGHPWATLVGCLLLLSSFINTDHTQWVSRILVLPFHNKKSEQNESASLDQKLPTYRAFLRKYIRGEFELYLGSNTLYTHDFFENNLSMHTQSRFSDQSIYLPGFSHIRSIHFFLTYTLIGGVTNLCCCTTLLEIHTS